LNAKARHSPAPPAVKRYRRKERVQLPSIDHQDDFSQVLLSRRTWRRFSQRELSTADLSTLLGLTWGVQGWFKMPAPQSPLAKKTSPSGGARHAIEVYVLARRVRDLRPGIYHYEAGHHVLELLRPGADRRQIARYLPAQWWFESAAALMIMTAVFPRVQWKYEMSRAYRMVLIEAGPRILPALPEKLAGAAHAELETLGVRVLTDTRVTEVTADAIVTGGGERIPSELRVWAAGVRGAATLDHIGGLETNPNCQLLVRPTLQTTLDDRVFALGDCCSCPDPKTGRAVPPRAQAAHQMASAVFHNLVRLMDGRDLVAFEYHDHGSLVSISRFSTVGSLMGNLIGGRMAIEGRIARFVYVSLYRMHLIAIHGWLRGLGLIVIGRVNTIIRPRLKLH